MEELMKIGKGVNWFNLHYYPIKKGNKWLAEIEKDIPKAKRKFIEQKLGLIDGDKNLGTSRGVSASGKTAQEAIENLWKK
jgi:hypothetical protein